MRLRPAGVIRTGGPDPRGFLVRLVTPERADRELSMLWSLFANVVTSLLHWIFLLSLSSDLTFTLCGEGQPP